MIRVRGGYAQYQAGRRDYAVVGAEHGGAQPTDAITLVILRVAARSRREAPTLDRNVARCPALHGHTGFLCDPSHSGGLAVALQPQK